MRITVLKGGWSPEREISLASAENVVKIFKQAGHEVYEIDVIKDLKYITNELYKSKPDYIFNALHGIGGEDGIIQGVLEIFEVPYSHSNVLASAIGFDKYICELLANYCIQDNNVKVLNSKLYNFDQLQNATQYPCIIKPVSNGSSVGIIKINNEDEFKQFKQKPWNYKDLLLQPFIKGNDFTVLVYNGKAIGSVEILYQSEFYDYETKYKVGGSQHISEFNMPEYTKNNMYKFSENLFKLCRCNGIARIDFRYDGTDVYFLEINTQPGITSTSLVPDIAPAYGMNLIDLLI